MRPDIVRSPSRTTNPPASPTMIVKARGSTGGGGEAVPSTVMGAPSRRDSLCQKVPPRAVIHADPSTGSGGTGTFGPWAQRRAVVDWHQDEESLIQVSGLGRPGNRTRSKTP